MLAIKNWAVKKEFEEFYLPGFSIEKLRRKTNHHYYERTDF